VAEGNRVVYGRTSAARRVLYPVLILLAAAALVPRTLRARERALTVFAAASLTDAFNALKAPFERAHPGLAVWFSFGASSTLRLQIEQGAPADLFASADTAQMRPLVSRRLVSTPRTFARNRLVVVVPKADPGKVRSVRDLARPGLRVVTTSETVPIGRYTQQVLERLSHTRGYPPDFGRRVNAGVISREMNVRAVLVKVELAEADAAIVYESDARSSARVRAIPIPASANVTAQYPIAVVATTRRRSEAEAFTRFLLSPQGQTILRQHGFR
jgi:molybdate transport system substrate-binding protein